MNRRNVGWPSESRWSTELYLRHTPKLFEKIREACGEDVHLLHDCHHRLTPIEAARLGKELEPFHLFWLEDPVPAELQEGFKLLREHTTTPIATGEVFNTILGCSRSDPAPMDRLHTHVHCAWRGLDPSEEDG